MTIPGQPTPRGTIVAIGFYSLFAQVVIIRELFCLFAGNEFLLAFLLAGWLGWVSLGSTISARLLRSAPELKGGLAAGGVLLLVTVALLRIMGGRLLAAPGEMVPYGKAVAISVAAAAPCALVAGHLFAAAVRALPEPLAGPKVYGWESLGSGFAGVALGIIILPRLGVIASIFFLVVAAVAWALGGGLRSRGAKLAGAVLFVASIFSGYGSVQQADQWLESFKFRGYKLVEYTDTPYARIDVIAREGQSTLLANSVALATTGDRERAEELIHLPLLAHRHPGSVLLLGGALGGVGAELAKYPLEAACYVEVDEKLLEVATRRGLFKPERGLAVVKGDARSYLRGTRAKYDVIVLQVGEPLSLQLNRFYTDDFFRLVRSRLAPDGLLALALPGSENFLSPPSELFFACLYRTLAEVFPRVFFLPGSTSHLFAFADAKRTLSGAEIASEMRRRQIDTVYLTPLTLSFRLSPTRMQMAAGVRRKAPSTPVNEDLEFYAYLYDLARWNAQLGARWSERMAALANRRGSLFPACLLGSLVMLLVPLFWPREKATRLASTSMLMFGFTGMAGSLLILLGFQILWGSLYQWVALPSGFFMVGTGLSALGGVRAKIRAEKALPLLHLLLALVILLVLLRVRAGPAGAKSSLLALAMVLGGLLGLDFALLCGIKQRGAAPYLYSLDLVGGMVGAVGFVGLLLPVVGFALGALYLIVLNSITAVLLVLALFASSSPSRRTPRR